MQNTLTILGCSSALPTAERFPSAQVLQMLGRYFLIDCGEGTQIQLRRAKIPFSRLNNIFISHVHGDHYFGIWGVLSTFSMLGRKHLLHIWGPAILEKIVKTQLAFFGEEISFPIQFHHTDTNSQDLSLLFEDKKIEVFSFPLKHRIRTTGFLFREKPKLPNIRKEAIEKYGLSVKEIVAIKEGSDLYLNDTDVVPNAELIIPAPSPKSFAYCSDTAYNPKTAGYVQGTTLLYHESTFTEELKDRAKQTLHSTAKQAAEIASQAKVGKLVLGHYSARYTDLSVFADEAKSVFQNTVLGQDLQAYDF